VRLEVELVLVSPGLHQDQAQVADRNQPVQPTERPHGHTGSQGRAGQQQQQNILKRRRQSYDWIRNEIKWKYLFAGNNNAENGLRKKFRIQ
jgi:uncharacterized surface anchored protein